MNLIRTAAPFVAALAACQSNWDVVEDGENYVLLWGGSRIHITSAEAPLGIAIDAACEFMDREREDNVPPFIGSRDELMQFCVGRSWKQK